MSVPPLYKIGQMHGIPVEAGLKTALYYDGSVDIGSAFSGLGQEPMGALCVTITIRHERDLPLRRSTFTTPPLPHRQARHRRHLTIF